jgi:D-xylose transport system ATP-binding protein
MVELDKVSSVGSPDVAGGIPSWPLIEMRNIRKHFGGVLAVDDVSVALNRGEVVGILGHNGAGKSTLMGILAGAVPRDSGSILMDGQPLRIETPRDARDAGIEMIYQTLALADNLDAVMNIFLGREDKRARFFRRDGMMEQKALEALHRVNPRFSNVREPVRNLSGGQRQSIAIARALYFNAKVLVMDEPTAALGPAETAAFKELVARIRTSGVGILIISHDIHDVFELSDRLVVMASGRIVGERRTSEVSKDEILRMVVLGLSATRAS